MDTLFLSTHRKPASYVSGTYFVLSERHHLAKKQHEEKNISFDDAVPLDKDGKWRSYKSERCPADAATNAERPVGTHQRGEQSEGKDV